MFVKLFLLRFSNFFELYNEDASTKKIFQLATHIGFGHEKELKDKKVFIEITKPQQKQFYEQILSGELFSLIIATSSNWLGGEFLKLGYYKISASSIDLLDEYTVKQMPARFKVASDCFMECLNQGLDHLFSFTSESTFLYQIMLSKGKRC